MWPFSPLSSSVVTIKDANSRAREHKVPHDANHVIRDTREHKVPHDTDHVIMVGRDVHGAPRTRGRHRRRQRGRGPPEMSAPTRDTREHKVPHDADHVIMVGADVPGAPRTRGRQRRRHRERGPPGTSAPTRDTRGHKMPYDDVMRHHWNMFIFAGMKPRSTEQDLPSTTSDRFIGICPSFHLKRKTSWNPCASSIKPSMIY